jgi:hypothetical protein
VLIVALGFFVSLMFCRGNEIAAKSFRNFTPSTKTENDMERVLASSHILIS